MADLSTTGSRRQGMKLGRCLACLTLVAAMGAVSGIGAQTVAAAGASAHCLRAEKPPAPGPGEVVIAGPLRSHGENVEVIPMGAGWTPTGFCASVEAMMSHPGSIEVGAGAALLLKGSPLAVPGLTGLPLLTSAWGARDDKSDPVLWPRDLDFSAWGTTIEAQTVSPEHLLEEFDSCRDCVLPRIDFKPTKPLPLEKVAYAGDVSGADLQGATFRGTFDHWNFDRADLRNAKLTNTGLFEAHFEHTTVDHADFDGADLRGVHFTALRFDAPPHFANVEIGGNNNGVARRRPCTVFRDTDLAGTGLSIRRITITDLSDCPWSPLLPGSTAPLRFLAQAVKVAKSVNQRLNLDGATFVATAADRTDAAGADLSGQTLKGARFVGFPASFVKTNFSQGELQNANFDGAELSGAKFDNADLAGASFQGADLADPGAQFAGADTNLSRANFIDADISGASFVGADLSRAVFSHALAENTNFNGVRAPRAVFTGTHIYGDGQAFDSANNLRGADFNGAVLAGNIDESGGFNFTHADLTDATFDHVQCVGCNFTDSTLDDVHFIGAYLPGVVLTDVKSMSGAKLHDAWLYCGNRANRECAAVGTSGERWKWALKLGSGEDYGPVPFAQANLANAPFSEVATCPDNKPGTARPTGCAAQNLLPRDRHAPAIPAECSAAGPDGVCPTPTSTLLHTSSLEPTGANTPTAIAAARPADLITTHRGRGVYVALTDGTIRLIEGREDHLVAGRPGHFCLQGPCGNGGLASDALLGHVTGLAVGVDGSLYVADAGNHTVRRIGPKGNITAVAGLSGHSCDPTVRGSCGRGGPATDAGLAGPFGVWVDPAGRVYIADGEMGVRVVQLDGDLGSVRPFEVDVRGVVGDAAGDLYAATRHALFKIDLKDKMATKVVGTGGPGYNGNRAHGRLALGTDVEITEPSGLSVARNGNVLFADRRNGLIRAYVPDTRHVINLAGKVVDEKPRSGFNGDGHSALETELDDPVAVATLTDVEFVVADAGNHRVRMFGPGPR